MQHRKRVGIFIRVSTDIQVKDESPEHHIKRAELYAEAKDWQIAEIYRLDGVSGKSVMEHPETKRMLADIKSGHITALVFSKLARLARNTIELLQLSKLFQAHNADLISLSESIDTSTPAGRFFFALISSLAEWEREEISARVAASVSVRARLGKSTGGAASFGFKWQGKAFVIDEKEAPVRKLLYELFLLHQRKKRVAAELNQRGYRTRNGSPFSDTTVGRLLRDSTAKGERRANYTKSKGANKQWTLKPASEWIVLTCPAIVSSVVWDECNRILDEQEGKRKKPGRTAKHLLSGYVTCTCAKPMYVYHASKVYECRACKNRIAVADLDDIYQEYLKGYLTETDFTTYTTATTHDLAKAEELHALTLAERTTLTERMTELVNMRLDKELDKAGFAELYKPVEMRVAQMNEQLPKLEATIDLKRVQLMSAETVLTEAHTLYSKWQTMDFADKRGLIETITSHIIIGTEDIDIKLAYDPASFRNEGNKQRHFRDS